MRTKIVEKEKKRKEKRKRKRKCVKRKKRWKRNIHITLDKITLSGKIVGGDVLKTNCDILFSVRT